MYDHFQLKRTSTTILFLTIVLVNLGGYRLLTGYLQTHVNDELEARLDKQQYDENDLISVKTPLNLPYYSSSAFERVSGEISVKGVIYKYVKRRVYNDTLEVLCIKDQNRTSLQHAKDEFYKQSNGLASHNKKPGSSGPVKPVFFDYCNQFNQFSYLFPSTNLKHSLFYIPGSGTYVDRLVEQPPECCCFV